MIQNALEPIRSSRQVPWRRLLGYLRPHWLRMAIAIVGLVISSLVSLA